MVRLTDRPDMTLDVYLGRKTTQQQQLTWPIAMLPGKTNVSITNFILLDTEQEGQKALNRSPEYTGQNSNI